MREHYTETSAHLDLLRQHDGYDSKRKDMAFHLANRVQNNLVNLQNPPDCSKAKILVCENKADSNGQPICGWGCIINHALLCFRTALATGRMLVLDEDFYGLSKHFQPLSSKCQNMTVPETHFQWPDDNEERVVRLVPMTPQTATKRVPRIVPQEFRNAIIFEALPSDLSEQILWVEPSILRV